MTAELEECIHGLGPVECCTICNGREQRERLARAEADRPIRTWTAKFPGHCEVCRARIEIGEPIGMTADGRYICGSTRG